MLFFNLTASSVKNARNTIPCHELPIYRLLFVMLFLAVPAAVPNIVFFCCSGRCAKQYCRRSGIVPLGVVLLLFRPVCCRSSYFELFLHTSVYVVCGIPGERIPQSISYVGLATSGLIGPFILTLVVRLLM